jgi:hypothetical protein
VNNAESVPFDKYNWNDKVKKDEMSRACSTHEEKRHIGIYYFGGKARRI